MLSQSADHPSCQQQCRTVIVVVPPLIGQWDLFSYWLFFQVLRAILKYVTTWPWTVCGEEHALKVFLNPCCSSDQVSARPDSTSALYREFCIVPACLGQVALCRGLQSRSVFQKVLEIPGSAPERITTGHSAQTKMDTGPIHVLLQGE